MNIDRIKKLTIGIAMLALAPIANAHLDDLGTFSLDLDNGNPDTEAEWIEETQGPFAFELVYLEKFNFDGGFDGLGAAPEGDADYDPGDGGTSSDISWDLTGTGFEANYVLIKDGAADDGGTLYRLYEVVGDQEIVGDGTVAFDDPDFPVKDISHISWFGSTPGTSVPDGGATVALFGLSILGLGLMRRILGKRAA